MHSRSYRSVSMASQLLLFLVYLEAHGTYLKTSTCPSGLIFRRGGCIPCQQNTYWLRKQGIAQCERCTQVCAAQRHLKQVAPCTSTSNRECHCDVGFFCASTAQFTCRRCLPCPPGTFSNATSRDSSCRAHTQCASLGMAVIAEGSATHDQVCGHI